MATESARTIRTLFEAKIASGELSVGERLPSVRDLSDSLGVSPATVAAAYRELRQRGLVIGRGRQGTRVAPVQRPEPASGADIPAGLVNATNGSPDPAMLPSLAPALSFAASLPQPHYGGQLVDPLLAEAAVDLFARDNIDAAHVTVTSGAMDAVERVLGALDLRIGDRIGVEDPGHIPVHQLARSKGLELVPLPVDSHGITAEGLEQAIAAGLTAIVVTPRAHNPTGAAFTKERAASLTSLLAPHPHIAVIQDDHAGLVAGTSYFPITPPGPRWATMRSLGKSLGPDIRVALLAGDDLTVHRVASGLSNGPGWVSFVLQRLAAYLLTDSTTSQLLVDASASYTERREQLIDALAGHGIEATGASGLNVWIPTHDEQAGIELARAAGYAIRGAAPYRITSAPAVRVTISRLSTKDIDALAAALAPLSRSRIHAAAM